MLQNASIDNCKILFRILQKKSASGYRISAKMKNNIKNMNLLSEDELCNLWKDIKRILLDVKQLFNQKYQQNEKYLKEYKVMLKLLQTITVMGSKTIIERTFIPNSLLEVVVLLHSSIFPNITDKKVKDQISCFLEQWWTSDLIWKNKVIRNPLKHVITCSKTSLLHVKRLNSMKSAVSCLKNPCDRELLLCLVEEKTLMSLNEGRAFILYLFTLGDEYIMGIHRTVKRVLEQAEYSFVVGYGNLYATAWLNATDPLRSVITEKCIQDILFYSFRTNRDFEGRNQLGNNLLVFLSVLHSHKNGLIRKMIYKQYGLLLWIHLKAPGSLMRCNAADVLFASNPIKNVLFKSQEMNQYRKKYYKALSDLLKDSNYEVCSMTITEVYKLLEEHWHKLPRNIVKSWLQALLSHAESTDNVNIRKATILGLKKVLNNKESHTVLGEFLGNFAASIYDADSEVAQAAMELIETVRDKIKVNVWDVIPMPLILDRLETTDDKLLTEQLVKFVWLTISNSSLKQSEIRAQICNMETISIKATKKFCRCLKSVVDWNTSKTFIVRIIKILEEDMEDICNAEQSEEQTMTNALKKAKLDLAEKKNVKVNNVNTYDDIDTLIKVVAMLLTEYSDTMSEENLANEMNEIFHLLANLQNKFYDYFKQTSINESLIFLLSLVPPKFVLSEETMTEVFINELANPLVKDSTIRSIVHLLVKWERVQLIWIELSDFLDKSIHKDNNDNVKIGQNGRENLQLILRILKCLIQPTYQKYLTNQYHDDAVKFWQKLDILKAVIEKGIDNTRESNDFLSDKIILDLFAEYISMIPLLYKENIFDASENFSNILLWIRRTIVSRAPNSNSAENSEMTWKLLEKTFSIVNNMIKQKNPSPKLCCDIVLLYCNCIIRPDGLRFVIDVFDALLLLLDYGKAAYEHNEERVLSTIFPNFLSGIMNSLLEHTETEIAKHTNNLKVIGQLMRKYYTIVESTFKDRNMHLSYLSIVITAVISNISMEVSRILQDPTYDECDILNVKFPYFAENILKQTFFLKRYQNLWLDALSQIILTYSKIDKLSACVMMHKMLKSSVNVRKLKKLAAAIKLNDPEESYNTPFERTIKNAMTIVIVAIVRH